MARTSSRIKKNVTYTETHGCEAGFQFKTAHCDVDETMEYVIKKKTIWLCDGCKTKHVPNANKTNEEEEARCEEEEEDDEYQQFVSHHNNISKDRINTFKNDIKRGSMKLLEAAPDTMRETMITLLTNGITFEKIRAYMSSVSLCTAVVNIVVPDAHVVTTRIDNPRPRRPEGKYFVIVPGHAVAVIRTSTTAYVYDPNGKITPDIKKEITELFGNNIVLCDFFCPHRTEKKSLLSDNIFLGVHGRCACWSLFVLMCFQGWDGRSETMEGIHTFFREQIHGSKARILSTHLLCFFVRVLWLYGNNKEPRRTCTERALLLEQLNVHEKPTFAYLRELRPRVREVIEASKLHETNSFFFKKRAGGSGIKSCWTKDKLLDWLETGYIGKRRVPTLIINQFNTTTTRGGQTIDPPVHMKVVIEFKYGTFAEGVRIDRCGGEHHRQDLDCTIAVRASVPYDMLQLNLPHGERLTWHHVLEWIEEQGDKKFGNLRYNNGTKIIDFKNLLTSRYSDDEPDDERIAGNGPYHYDEEQECFAYAPKTWEVMYNPGSVLHAGMYVPETSYNDKGGLAFRPVLSLDRILPERDYGVYNKFKSMDGVSFNRARPQFSYLLTFRQVDEIIPSRVNHIETRLYERFVSKNRRFRQLTATNYLKYLLYGKDEVRDHGLGNNLALSKWWIRDDGLVGLRQRFLRVANQKESNHMNGQNKCIGQRMNSLYVDQGEIEKLPLLVYILVQRERTRILFYDRTRLTRIKPGEQQTTETGEKTTLPRKRGRGDDSFLSEEWPLRGHP